MNTIEAVLRSATGTVWRGRVLQAVGAGLLVEEHSGLHRAVCAVLQTSEVAPLKVRPGDVVLCAGGDRFGELGIVLGRITLSGPPTLGEGLPDSAHSRDVPDTIVLEARGSLTLKVGDGSITIREDGKILIKGTHLVSHAKKMNRVRGGSVAIN